MKRSQKHDVEEPKSIITISNEEWIGDMKDFGLFMWTLLTIYFVLTGLLNSRWIDNTELIGLIMLAAFPFVIFFPLLFALSYFCCRTLWQKFSIYGDYIKYEWEIPIARKEVDIWFYGIKSVSLEKTNSSILFKPTKRTNKRSTYMLTVKFNPVDGTDGTESKPSSTDDEIDTLRIHSVYNESLFMDICEAFNDLLRIPFENFYFLKPDEYTMATMKRLIVIMRESPKDGIKGSQEIIALRERYLDSSKRIRERLKNRLSDYSPPELSGLASEIFLCPDEELREKVSLLLKDEPV